jgi:hypothetical protein
MDFAFLISSVSSILPYIGAGFVIFYLLILFWVAKDIAYRSTSVFVQTFCIALAVCVPFIGLAFYLLIRPELLVHKEIREFLQAQKEAEEESNK